MDIKEKRPFWECPLLVSLQFRTIIVLQDSLENGKRVKTFPWVCTINPPGLYIFSILFIQNEKYTTEESARIVERLNKKYRRSLDIKRDIIDIILSKSIRLCKIFEETNEG